MDPKNPKPNTGPHTLSLESARTARREFMYFPLDFPKPKMIQAALAAVVTGVLAALPEKTAEKDRNAIKEQVENALKDVSAALQANRPALSIRILRDAGGREAANRLDWGIVSHVPTEEGETPISLGGAFPTLRNRGGRQYPVIVPRTPRTLLASACQASGLMVIDYRPQPAGQFQPQGYGNSGYGGGFTPAGGGGSGFQPMGGGNPDGGEAEDFPV